MSIATPSMDFPPSHTALEEPNGLLAAGGDLSVPRLLAAYRRGIFPWFEPGEAILWWTPDPRAVLFPDQLHISRSLAKTLRKHLFHATVNRNFATVMKACASAGGRTDNTWIGSDIEQAYTDLHHLGYAHSVEIYDREKQLCGGLYGVCLGQVFFGESMFSTKTDASKVALVTLVNIAKQAGIAVIDCQQETAHLRSMGASSIRRSEFEDLLSRHIDAKSLLTTPPAADTDNSAPLWLPA